MRMLQIPEAVKDPVVLLVEDSEPDAALMRVVFERAQYARLPHICSSGEDVISYLCGRPPYSDRRKYPAPTAVLLDLKLPQKSGFEVLEWIRSQPAFQHIHVYILTASRRAEDIRRAYALGANAYLVKPSNLDDLMRMAVVLLSWLRIGQFVRDEEGRAGRKARAGALPQKTARRARKVPRRS